MIKGFELVYLITTLIQTTAFREFGAWSISQLLFDHIRLLLPAGKTILEFGSGWGSGQLARYYTVYSIEHNQKWLNKYPTNYIYAPIVNGWYDTQILAAKLPTHYDLILVDGPTGFIGRKGFYTNLKLFNTNVPIIFDDTDRPAELELINLVSQKLNRPYTLFDDGNKSFGVILPAKPAST